MNLQKNFFLKFVFYYHSYSSLNMWDLLKIYLWFRWCRCIKVKISHPCALLPAQPSTNQSIIHNARRRKHGSWVLLSACFWKGGHQRNFSLVDASSTKEWRLKPSRFTVFYNIKFELNGHIRPNFFKLFLLIWWCFNWSLLTHLVIFNVLPRCKQLSEENLSSANNPSDCPNKHRIEKPREAPPSLPGTSVRKGWNSTQIHFLFRTEILGQRNKNILSL